MSDNQSSQLLSEDRQVLAQTVVGSVSQISTASGLYDIHDSRKPGYILMDVNTSFPNYSTYTNHTVVVSQDLILLNCSIILNASTAFTNSQEMLMFTLPQGYRPFTDMFFFRSAITSNAGQMQYLNRLNVYADGRITFVSSANQTVGGVYVPGIPIALNAVQ